MNQIQAQYPSKTIKKSKIINMNMSHRELYVDENGQLANGEYNYEKTTKILGLDNLISTQTTLIKGEVKNGVKVGKWITEEINTYTDGTQPSKSKRIETFIDEKTIDEKKLEPYRIVEYYSNDKFFWKRKYAHSRTNYGIDYNPFNDICLREDNHSFSDNVSISNCIRIENSKIAHAGYAITQKDGLVALTCVDSEYDKGFEYQDKSLTNQNWTVSLNDNDFKFFIGNLHKDMTKPCGADIVIDYAEMFYDNHKKMLTIKPLEDDKTSVLVQIYDRDGEAILCKKIVSMCDLNDLHIPMLDDYFEHIYSNKVEYYRKMLYDKLYNLCTHNITYVNTYATAVSLG